MLLHIKFCFEVSLKAVMVVAGFYNRTELNAIYSESNLKCSVRENMLLARFIPIELSFRIISSSNQTHLRVYCSYNGWYPLKLKKNDS